MFSGFWKLILTAGLVGVGALIFAIMVHNEKTTEIELEKATQTVKEVEFNTQFDESWLQGMAEMAESEVEKEEWVKKAAIAKEKNSAKLESAETKLGEARQDHDIARGKVKQLSDDMEQAMKDVPEISDEEFNEALKQMEANQ